MVSGRALSEFRTLLSLTRCTDTLTFESGASREWCCGAPLDTPRPLRAFLPPRARISAPRLGHEHCLR